MAESDHREKLDQAEGHAEGADRNVLLAVARMTAFVVAIGLILAVAIAALGRM